MHSSRSPLHRRPVPVVARHLTICVALWGALSRGMLLAHVPGPDAWGCGLRSFTRIPHSTRIAHGTSISVRPVGSFGCPLQYTCSQVASHLLSNRREDLRTSGH